MKRLIYSLIGGLICAFICFTGRYYLIPGISMSTLIVSSFGNRLLIGFVIGISRWKINYILHGLIIGLLVTFSYSIGMLIDKNIEGFIPYTIVGMIFGILIELFVTKLCKAKIA